MLLISLPDEILEHILNNCSQKQLASISKTCKKLHLLSFELLYREPTFPSFEQLVLFQTHLNPQKASRIRQLDISLTPHRWTLFNDAHVLTFASCPRLRLLDLDRCVHITDKAVAFIANSYGSTLTDLFLGSCEKISDVGILAVAHWCAQLEYLDISGTGVTDLSLTEIASRCLQLYSLDVSGCENLTELSISACRSNLKHLKILDLTDCYGVVFGAGQDGEEVLYPGLVTGSEE